MNYYDSLVIESMEIEQEYRAYIAVCADQTIGDVEDMSEFMKEHFYMPPSAVFFEDAVRELRDMPYIIQTGIKHAYIARRLGLNVYQETKRAVRYANS